MISKKNIVVIGLILSASVLVFFIFRKSSEIQTVHPQTGQIKEAVYSLGKVKSNQVFEIKLGVVATVQRLYVREGDVVLKNQLLLQLDTGSIFKSPFSGTVSMIKAHEGEMIAPQMTLLKIENLKDLYIELALEQESALRVKKSQPAKISFESLRGEKLNGYVESLFSQNEEFIAKIKIEKLPENVLPGMSADVAVVVGEVQGQLIPIRAVKNGTITLIRDGRKQKIPVEIGLTDNLSAQVKSPVLLETDEVLISSSTSTEK